MFQTLHQAQKNTDRATFKALHNQALLAAQELRTKEVNLVLALQDLDAHLVYRYIGFNSLFQYCVQALKLTRAQAMMYISVARKAREIPTLQKAITSGEVSISKVQRIIPVIKQEDSQEWIDLVKTSTKREVEKAVAKVNPRAVFHEKSRYLTDTLIELNIPVSEETFDLIKRVQDIVGQKTSKVAKMEDAIETACLEYLNHHDPIKRHARRQQRLEKKLVREGLANKQPVGHPVMLEAQKPEVRPGILGAHNREVQQSPLEQIPSQSKNYIQQTRQSNQAADAPPLDHQPPKQNRHLTQLNTRAKIPPRIREAIISRDDGRCTHQDSNGRCAETRWLHVHHKVYRGNGGTNRMENLTTLCHGHHQYIHLCNQLTC